MHNGTRYSSELLDSRYDAIVIGSGLSGLTTAALLAKAGKKVLVLERHYTAGGFTHSYTRHGYEWDVGVHYIGEVHKPHSPLRRVFDTITNSQLQWAKMDDVFDQIIIKDQQYNFVAGSRNFKEELLKSFPHGKQQIDDYISTIRRATRSMPAHFGQRYLPPFLQQALAPALGKMTGNYFNQTTQSVMAGIVQDPKLASVLCGQWGDYGLPPGQSSFGMHSVVATHYLGGASFPVGGASQIARHILPVIEASGGKVLVRAEVDTILLDKGRAIGVRMANGDEILSDTIVSAAGVHNTYGRLLPEEAGTRHKLDQKLTQVRPSVGHLGLYIGFKKTTQELQLPQANQWIYPDYDHDANVKKFLTEPNTDFPLTYISFPSAKDPAWNQNHPGRATIDVITLAPYDWFKPWQDKPWRKRGADYAAFKEKLSLALLEKVYQRLPHLRGKVDYYELSTPLSTAHFSNYARGEVYGLEHNPDRFAQSWIKPSTPIKGLYLTGQDILFCGVASAMMAGVWTATTLLGPRMAWVLDWWKK
jgi:all-trans-retinol 13,14-reductase